MQKALVVVMVLVLGLAAVQAADNTGTGGTITYSDANGSNAVVSPPYISGYVIHTFTNSGTYGNSYAVNADVLVVAGGGGGGMRHGGAGGAGGMIYSNAYSISPGDHTVTVGVGGAGADTADDNLKAGAPGSNSVFGTITAIGGGGGRTYAGTYDGAGGSGGGGSGQGSNPNGGTGIAGQGYDGGSGSSTPNGSGGGGAAEAGEGGTPNGGDGGDGVQLSISGVATYYAGGGGGGGDVGNTGGAGGLGGGGHGGDNGVNTSQTAGTDGTGGGGGGCRSDTVTAPGSDGGSGIVIIRYPYDPGSLSVSVSSPTAGQQFLPGSSVTATVAVASGEAPYDVTFYTNSAVAWSTNAASTSLFTIALGMPADGTYTNYATVTDNLSSNATSATNTFTVGADTNAPTPDPMTFAVEPTSLGTNRVVMTASTATDTLSPPVEYYFVNTTNSADSGWILSTVWTNTGLTNGVTYGYRVKARDAVSNETGYSAIFDATPTQPTVTWDHDADGTVSDGGGTWLNANQWLDGGTPVTWNNIIPNNAIIGSGGAGGTITLGAVTAGTVLIDNFTGTYTLSGTSLDQSGGITVGTNAGNVTINSDLSGTGGVTVNGPSRVNLRNGSKTYSGDLVINAGEVLEHNMGGLGTGNMTLNGGIMVDYWGGNFNRTLGPGPGQVQILGGESGFCGQGRNGFSVRLNDGDGEVMWGDPLFNPTELVLQSPWSNFDGKITWRNQIDLNGATRTVTVDKDEGNSGGTLVDGYAQMIGTIRNSDATNPAGLIKEGPGRLILNAANTYDGGTTVNEGSVQYDRADAMPSTNNHAFNDGTELWVSLKGGDDFTSASSGAGSLGGLLTGVGPGSATVSYTGTVDLVLRPSGSPDYDGPLSMPGGAMGDLWVFDGSMTIGGTGDYTGSTTIGRIGGPAITVTLGSSTALPSGTPVQVDSSVASKLDLNGFDATIGLLTLGSNNGGQRGQISDTAGTGTLTLTNGVFCDNHNNGNGGIFAGFLDLNGATQTFSVRDGTQSSDLLITSVVQNGGLIFDAVHSGAGLELAGTNTYTGGTQVSGGKLIVSGSLGGSSMTISGGTVEGTGELIFNVTGATSDQIVITGGTLDASALAVNVNPSGPTKTEYVIVEATDEGMISGQFVNNLPNGWDIDYTATTVTLTAPPTGTRLLVR